MVAVDEGHTGLCYSYKNYSNEQCITDFGQLINQRVFFSFVGY